MERYGSETYGDRIAEVYDGLYTGLPTEATVETLAELAGGGPVLELAIGTGRIALPLRKRGLDVHGVDASEAMVAKLREKPGGDGIPVTIGDFADVPVDGRFRLVFVVFNTFFALETQEDQVRCFRNVAEHLTDDGVFVVEAFVPDLSRFDRGQRVYVNRIELDEVWLNTDLHDQAAQHISTQHVALTESGARFYPVSIRYAYPPELDLMARLAGLRLRERWGGWDRQRFDADSTQHVSVYERGS